MRKFSFLMNFKLLTQILIIKFETIYNENKILLRNYYYISLLSYLQAISCLKTTISNNQFVFMQYVLDLHAFMFFVNYKEFYQSEKNYCFSNLFTYSSRKKNIFNLTGYCIRCIKMILDFMNIFISAPWDMVIIIKAPNF